MRPPARPILVTGMPRSGTTWLARELANAPGVAMTGREPMNARNRQYALGGTIDAWTRLDSVTPRQSWILRSSYRGLNPWVYGRYGHQQWLAPFPWIRCVVKDPFALLSIPAIISETDADVVVVYRHPGAVLASWQRMGWTAKRNEVMWAEGLVKNAQEAPGELGGSDEVDLLARLWRGLHRVLLEDIEDGAPVHLVAHEEISLGGPSALREVFDSIGLRWAGHGRGGSTTSGSVVSDRLHNLDRDPREVARAWVHDIDDEELARLEKIAGSTLEELERIRLPMSGGGVGERGAV